MAICALGNCMKCWSDPCICGYEEEQNELRIEQEKQDRLKREEEEKQRLNNTSCLVVVGSLKLFLEIRVEKDFNLIIQKGLSNESFRLSKRELKTLYDNLDNFL